MTKAKMVLMACFCAAFGAGLIAGVVVARLTAAPPHGSWLEQELNLTPKQREQMRQIWSSALKAAGPPPHEQRQALQKERDEAVRRLLNDDQKARYDELLRTYAEKAAALDEARRKAFDDAVERTKQILTEAQRKKYEKLLEERGGRHGRRGFPGGPGMPPPPPGPTRPPK